MEHRPKTAVVRRDVQLHQQAVVNHLVKVQGLTLEEAQSLFQKSYLPRAYERYPEEALHEDPAYLAQKLLADYRPHSYGAVVSYPGQKPKIRLTAGAEVRIVELSSVSPEVSSAT